MIGGALLAVVVGTGAYAALSRHSKAPAAEIELADCNAIAGEGLEGILSSMKGHDNKAIYSMATDMLARGDFLNASCAFELYAARGGERRGQARLNEGHSIFKMASAERERGRKVMLLERSLIAYANTGKGISVSDDVHNEVKLAIRALFSEAEGRFSLPDYRGAAEIYSAMMKRYPGISSMDPRPASDRESTAFLVGNAHLRQGMAYHNLATEARRGGNPAEEVKGFVSNAILAYNMFYKDFAGHPYITSENGVKYRMKALREEFKNAFPDLFVKR